MKIEQFEDKALSHYSYAILSEELKAVIIIDPSRNVEPYLHFAALHNAHITGVIETHPHADFVSGHLELHKTTGATIYCSKLTGAGYPHKTFDSGDSLDVGNIKLEAMNTPGHSPDSICVILEHDGADRAVFTGDTLFIGDCGRPDLREHAGNITAKREELAKEMYGSLHNKLMLLDNNVAIYPAHGAGTLCGKAVSAANCSTIGAEKISNWALQPASEEDFVNTLLDDQPFVPGYFAYDVALNRHGAANLSIAVDNVPVSQDYPVALPDAIIIDTRDENDFKQLHLSGSINIQKTGKFETWLGSIIAPNEPFYLTAANTTDLDEMILRCAKIGYEGFIRATFVFSKGNNCAAPFNIEAFYSNTSAFTIIDVRNQAETREKSLFTDAIAIPLPGLRHRLAEIPSNKPVVVHCAGGYRSAIGSSIINSYFNGEVMVFDLGEAVKQPG